MISVSKLFYCCTLLLAVACDRPSADRRWTVEVDTLPNGAVHVVNHPNATASDSSWTLQEELRIGAVDEDGPLSFGQIKGIAVAQDGRIAVLDAHAQEIRVFDAAGKHLITHGRQGGGPGEFAGAWGLMHGPDGNLWVPDFTNARMSVVDFAKGFVSSFPMQVRRWGWVWDGAMTQDGRILQPSTTTTVRPKNILLIYDAGMTVVDSLPMPGPEPVDAQDSPWAFHIKGKGNSDTFIGIPFQPAPQQWIDADGSVWSSAGDGSYRVTHWKPGGDTTLVIETIRPQVPVSAAERDSVIGDLRERFREYGAPDADWSRIPNTKPAIIRMFSGNDGRLWVQTASADSLRRFDVYDRTGRITSTAKTRLRLNRWVTPVVRGDSLWAVAVDEMDVQYVVRARIVH
jgi:hypothetical protein